MADRKSYIDNLVSFMIENTSRFGVTCGELITLMEQKFPEMNIVLDRHDISFFIDNPDITDECTLNKYIKKESSRWSAGIEYAEKNGGVKPFFSDRFKHEYKSTKESFDEFFQFRPVKAQDSLFDEIKYLDYTKVGNVIDISTDYYSGYHRNSGYGWGGHHSSLSIVELLMDYMRLYGKVFIAVTSVNDNTDRNIRVVLYKMIRNTRIIETDRDVIKFIDTFSKSVSTPVLFNEVFGYNISSDDYEMLGKLNTVTYAHESLNLLFKFVDIIHRDEEKLADLKSLVGLGKTSFKNRLIYLALSKAKRPFPDLKIRDEEYDKMCRENKGKYISRIDDIYTKLGYCGESYRTYPPMEIIDAAIEVLDKRHKSYLASKKND